MDKFTTWDYRTLPQNGYTIVEYVWIGGHGSDIRCKAKTYKGEITSISQISKWNYDGSSTGQEKTETSEIEILPVALFDDPFRGAPNKICLCETRHVDGTPTLTNFRDVAKKIFDNDKNGEFDPWFGVEQEYILMKRIGSKLQWPLGWTPGEFPSPQGMYYCSTGTNNVIGREISDAHYKACLYAGIKIFGTNAEVFPGQWEYQIGTCNGIELADHLWVSRFLLMRVAEKYEVDVNFEPKPIKGDWNGSGAHCNYSTNKTRNDTDMKNIKECLGKLDATHVRFMKFYGEDNHLRLTGKHETSSMEKFSYNPLSRSSSVRIPRQTQLDGKGYFEDRRPASNIDPYVITAAIFSVTCLDNFCLEDIEKQYEKFKSHKKTIKMD